MKIFIEPQPNSRAICRIEDYLKKYIPASAQLVENYLEADLVVLPIFGRLEHRRLMIQGLQAMGKRYAMLQLSLQSTRNPNPADWLDLWNGAQAVWSYYNLNLILAKAGLRTFLPNLYCAPLGADPEVFYPLPLPERRYSILTMGNYNKDIECLDEVNIAVKHTHSQNIHIGAAYEAPSGVGWQVNSFCTGEAAVADETLNLFYNSAKFVSALRRKDGFEMPAAEGLLSGARPIMFDNPNFRQWFDGLALFIPETSPNGVIQNLISILSKDPGPLPDWVAIEAKKQFDWQRLVTEFWELCQ